MITIVQLLLFIIITALSVRYIFTPVTLIPHPFVEKAKFQATGTQCFLLFLLASSILSLGNFMAMRLFVSILLVLIAIFYDKNRPAFSITTLTYALFLLWLLCAIYYSPVREYGFRVFLKYSYPFLLLILAAKLSSNPVYAHKALKVIFMVGVVGALYLFVVLRIPLLSRLLSPYMWWFPAILDFMGVPLAISLAYYTMLKKKKYLWSCLLFVLPCLVNVNRTGLLVVSISIAIFALIRYNLRSIPYLLLAGGILIGSILYIPSIREKMFVKEYSAEYIIENRDILTAEDINSSGRFAMWEWSLKNYYEGNELFGSGLGVLQERFYSLDHPFGELQVVHNDYVQLLCDTGLVGLILYVSIFVFMIVHSISIFYSKNNQPVVKLLAIISATSIAGMTAALYTDNAVNYSLMTLGYPFAIYGMMVGLRKTGGT